MSFKKMKWRKKRYADCTRREKIVKALAYTVGKLENVTVMIVVSGISSLYKPVIVFTGRKLHYQTINGDKRLHWTGFRIATSTREMFMALIVLYYLTGQRTLSKRLLIYGKMGDTFYV